MPPRIKKARKLSPVQAMAAAAASAGSTVDLYGQVFTIGRELGRGGFGSIHIASPGSAKCVEQAPYVAKVELMTHSAGKMEVLCYSKCLLRDPSISKQSTEWAARLKLKNVGLGSMITSKEAVSINGQFFRVCILRRLGPSLGAELRLAEGDKVTLAGPTALRIALPLIDSLEFMHSRGYAHADIKPANVCYGQYAGDGTKGTFTDKDKLFLIDFGLASPFSGKPMDLEGNHIEYDPNPKIKHNGTLKYTSVDAHAGVYPSRRTDVHILGYVMLNLAGTLPWLADCETVSDANFARVAAKVEKMKLSFSGTSGAAGLTAAKAKTAAANLVKACCADPSAPGVAAIQAFLAEAFALSYAGRPDYKKLRAVLTKGIPAGKAVPFDEMVGSAPAAAKAPSKAKAKAKPAPGKKASAGDKRKAVEVITLSDDDSDAENSPAKVAKRKATPRARAKGKGKGKVAAAAAALLPTGQESPVFESESARRLYRAQQRFERAQKRAA